MLFSNPEVASAMNERFECAWRSVGDVSRARIEFSDGSSMERTLGGNVVTWICDMDGAVLDIMPGLMDANAYLVGIERGSAALTAKNEEARNPNAKRMQWDFNQVDETLGWGDHILWKILPSTQNVRPATFRGDDPLASLEPFPTTSQAAIIDAFDVSIAKSVAIEDPVVKVVGLARPDDFSNALEEDTWLANYQLRPQALALLRSLVYPKDSSFINVDYLSPYVYRLVLHVDARDPYLGMKQALLGRTDAFLSGPAVSAQ